MRPERRRGPASPKRTQRSCAFAATGSVKRGEKTTAWGRLAARGVGELALVDGAMDQRQRVEAVETAAARSAELSLWSQSWASQQGSDPKRAASDATSATRRLQTPLEDWPSQSPDLNPIESLWSILDRSISDRRCNTKAELWECLQEAWYKLDSSILTKLVESMPRRLNAVIDNKGYPTKY